MIYIDSNAASAPRSQAAAENASHTPTPWQYSPNSFGTQFIYGDLEKPKQTPMGVSYFHLVCGGDHPGTLSEVDAAFIVKAANSHQALLARIARLEADLLDCRDYIDRDTEVIDSDTGPRPNRAMSLVSMIDETLNGRP